MYIVKNFHIEYWASLGEISQSGTPASGSLTTF